MNERKEQLRRHAVKTLRKVANYLENGEYDKIKDIVAYSPAGDGYGCENYYINLSDTDEPMDIMEVIWELQREDDDKEEKQWQDYTRQAESLIY